MNWLWRILYSWCSVQSWSLWLQAVTKIGSENLGENWNVVGLVHLLQSHIGSGSSFNPLPIFLRPDLNWHAMESVFVSFHSVWALRSSLNSQCHHTSTNPLRVQNWLHSIQYQELKSWYVVARMLQASWGRSDNQQQEQTSPNRVHRNCLSSVN